MTQDLDIGITQCRQVARRLIFLRSQRGMKCAENDVELSHRFRIHVALAARVQIHLNRAKNGQPRSAHDSVRRSDLARLFRQCFLIDPAGDFQPFRMIGDRDVLVTAGFCRFRHFQNRSRTVAPLGVHLQIAFQSLRPFDVCRQDGERIRPSKKITSNRRRPVCVPGWFSDPGAKLLFNERPNAMQLGQGPASADQVTRQFGPAKCATRGAPKRAHQDTGAGPRFSCQQFRQISVGKSRDHRSETGAARAASVRELRKCRIARGTTAA